MQNDAEFFSVGLTLSTANYNIIMQIKNQIVVISGILALLATATIAAGSYIAQPVKAACGQGLTQPYGSCISGCTTGQDTSGCSGDNSIYSGRTFAGAVSGLAQDNGGLHDFRSSGCPYKSSPTTNGADACSS